MAAAAHTCTAHGLLHHAVLDYEIRDNGRRLEQKEGLDWVDELILLDMLLD